MAGFQKFPVPRAYYIDAWAYNKRWIGNSLCLFIGSFFVGVSFYRYNLYRTVKHSLFSQLHLELVLTLIQIKLTLQNQCKSDKSI